MPDEITPGEQVISHQQAPEGFIELARYNGLVRKVEQLTLDNRSLNEQLTAKTSETEQLRAQLSVKDTEKSAAVGERDKQLQEAIQSRTALETEVNQLRALKLKLDTIKKLNRPDLVKIADKIPNMTDAEALESVLKEFASFADEAATTREKQLLAGITPGPGSGQTVSDNLPDSDQSWTAHIEKQPLGSPERQKAWDQYWGWLEARNK